MRWSWMKHRIMTLHCRVIHHNPITSAGGRSMSRSCARVGSRPWPSLVTPRSVPPFRAPDRFLLNTVRERLTQHAHLRLGRALRYTRPIYCFLKELQGEGSHDLAASLQTDGQLPDGPEVEIHQATAKQTPAVVEQILDHWKTSGLCVPSKVLILHDRSQIVNTPLAELERLLDHPFAPISKPSTSLPATPSATPPSTRRKASMPWR